MSELRRHIMMQKNGEHRIKITGTAAVVISDNIKEFKIEFITSDSVGRLFGSIRQAGIDNWIEGTAINSIGISNYSVFLNNGWIRNTYDFVSERVILEYKDGRCLLYDKDGNIGFSIIKESVYFYDNKVGIGTFYSNTETALSNERYIYSCWMKNENGIEYMLVPAIKNGQSGFIDDNTGTFYAPNWGNGNFEYI